MFPLVISWDINITTVVVAMMSLGGFVLSILRLRDRIEKTEVQSDQLNREINTLKEVIESGRMARLAASAEFAAYRERAGLELATFREKVAREYLERDIFERVAQQQHDLILGLRAEISSAIERLGERLDRVVEGRGRQG